MGLNHGFEADGMDSKSATNIQERFCNVGGAGVKDRYEVHKARLALLKVLGMTMGTWSRQIRSYQKGGNDRKETREGEK